MVTAIYSAITIYVLQQRGSQWVTTKRNPKPNSKGVKAVPMKTNYAVVETKSKRVQMLMQPSLYDAIKDKAEKEGVSVNEMMHEILKGHLEA